jgi:hypothetical protein
LSNKEPTVAILVFGVEKGLQMPECSGNVCSIVAGLAYSTIKGCIESKGHAI